MLSVANELAVASQQVFNWLPRVPHGIVAAPANAVLCHTTAPPLIDNPFGFKRLLLARERRSVRFSFN